MDMYRQEAASRVQSSAEQPVQLPSATLTATPTTPPTASPTAPLIAPLTAPPTAPPAIPTPPATPAVNQPNPPFDELATLFARDWSAIIQSDQQRQAQPPNSLSDMYRRK